MISLNQCWPLCPNCSNSLQMARFHYVSSFFFFFPFFFWLSFQSKQGFCNHGMCGYVSLSSSITFKATSQFQPELTEGWRGQGCSIPTCPVGRVGDAATQLCFHRTSEEPDGKPALRHKSPIWGSPPPAPRIISSFLLEILPASMLLRLIHCRKHCDRNQDFKTLFPFNNNN